MPARARHAGLAHKYGPLIRAWTIFGVTFGALQLSVSALSSEAKAPITAMLAWMTGGLATLLGTRTTVVESRIFTDGYALEVIWQCSGATPMFIFAAAVAAFPSSWRSKLIGWSAGFVLLFTANLMRLLTLLYAGMRYPAAFDTLHLRVWQPLLILLTVVLWLAWVMRFVPRDEPRPA